MSALLVAFDLETGRNQPQVQALLEKYDAMRFSSSAFAINTHLSPDTFFEQLQPLLGKDDLAYIVTLDKPWIGYGYEAMNDWLKRHLG